MDAWTPVEGHERAVAAVYEHRLSGDRLVFDEEGRERKGLFGRYTVEVR